MRIQFIRAALTAWLSMVVTVMIYIERFIYMIYMLPQYKSCPCLSVAVISFGTE